MMPCARHFIITKQTGTHGQDGTPPSVCSLERQATIRGACLCSCAAQLDSEHRLGNAGLWHGLAKARSALGRHLLAAEAYDAVVILAEGDLAREARASQVRALLAAEEWCVHAFVRSFVCVCVCVCACRSGACIHA